MRFQSLLVGFLISTMVGCSTQFVRESTEPIIGASSDEPIFTAVPAAKSAKEISLRDGPAVAALFNKNYNELTDSCIDFTSGKVKGYYYCTGVMVRTVDNGNFDPWSVSPAANALSGVSYSWIRHDVDVRNLYHAAGYVLLSPADLIAGAVPEITRGIDATTCVYPFDAWTTRTMDRRHSGCDDEGTGAGWPDPAYRAWGSCDQRYGFSSSTQWDTHFRNAGQINYRQCSWNADTPQGWRNMIASRRSFPAQNTWNEVMLRISLDPDATGERLRLWVTAFFYDPNRANGLADARAFQRKMYSTGKWVPVLRLNFSASSASRFQYVPGDQAITP